MQMGNNYLIEILQQGKRQVNGKGKETAAEEESIHGIKGEWKSTASMAVFILFASFIYFLMIYLSLTLCGRICVSVAVALSVPLPVAVLYTYYICICICICIRRFDLHTWHVPYRTTWNEIQINIFATAAVENIHEPPHSRASTIRICHKKRLLCIPYPPTPQCRRARAGTSGKTP